MTSPDTPNPYAVPEVESLLHQAMELVGQARPAAMSATVRVNRDELLDLLEAAADRLPEELRAATWLLKERDEFLDQARQEHDEIIAQGAAQVERMVQRQEIVKAAEARARQIVAEARAEARTLRRQTEDFCDQRLASFELVLERTMATVHQGRQKLHGAARVGEPIDLSGDAPNGAPAEVGAAGGWVPFDQDRGVRVGAYRVPIAELRRRLGQRRVVAVDHDPGPLEVGTTRTGGGPVTGELTIESIQGGVSVGGQLRATWVGECRRCLDDVRGDLEIDVHEIYQDHPPADSEMYELWSEDQLDLAPMIRESVMLALPQGPLCRATCEGPDPERFPATTSDEHEVRVATEPKADPRWAALGEVSFEEG